LKQIDNDGTFEYHSLTAVEVGVQKKGFWLSESYPNPCNPSTMLEFSVAQTNFVTVKVFGILGREVASLFSGIAEAGRVYILHFDAAQLTSGLYLIQLQSGRDRQVRKIMVLK
jgi:hypothetical protein